MGDTGAKEIANALQASVKLETLCLGFNAIGDDGASALTRVVAGNHALRRYYDEHICCFSLSPQIVITRALSTICHIILETIFFVVRNGCDLRKAPDHVSIVGYCATPV